ncbi:MAG: hypothetical protein U5K75_11030 [Ahrensia sp.]|nr:hypothetical protein [Ahrensia sp.]
MTNVARGEFAYKIAGKSYDFALTLKATAAIEKMTAETKNRPPFEEMIAIISAMTQGTDRPISVEIAADLPITIAEFKTIIQGATEAANAAMPEDRSVAGNESNRRNRRAAAAAKK